MNVFIVGLIILVIVLTLLGTLVWSNRNLAKKWVAVGNGDVTLAFSNDGINWTGVDGLFGDNTIGRGDSVYRAGDRWVVVGRDGDNEGANIWWSDDAEVWNLATNNDDEDDVFWGTGVDNTGKWVTRGSDNLWVAGGNGDVTSLYWSDDGKVWNESENAVMVGVDVIRVSHLGGLWLATGEADTDGNVLFYSEDGKTWTAASSSDGSDILGGANGRGLALAYRDGLWLMGGGNLVSTEKQIWWSEDGMTWTGVATSDTFGTDGQVNDIIFGDGKWVAVGESEGGPSAVLYSTNGKGWTEGSSNTGDHVLEDVVYSNGYFIVTAQDNATTDPVVFRSTDGITWEDTNFSSGTNNILQRLAANGSFSVITSLDTSGDESLWYSENNGLDWTAVEDNPFGVEGNTTDVIYS